MSEKSQYLIVQGASAVIVRDGKRVTITPGGGANFTESEVRAIRAAAGPGALRSPVNEGRGASVPDDSDAETIGSKKAPKATKAPKAAKVEQASEDDDEDI